MNFKVGDRITVLPRRTSHSIRLGEVYVVTSTIEFVFQRVGFVCNHSNDAVRMGRIATWHSSRFKLADRIRKDYTCKHPINLPAI